MNTSKQSAIPQPDELVNPKELTVEVESATPSESTAVVQSVSRDVSQQIRDVDERQKWHDERNKWHEQENHRLCKGARQLMEEADQWFSKLQQFAKEDDIEKWQVESYRLESIREALRKLLGALDMIKGRVSREACTLQDELVAKFSSLLNEYERAQEESKPRTHAESSAARHKILVEFLKIARNFHAEEGLPVGLEENIKAGIDELMGYSEWEGSMDRGMDLLELVCPFYSTSATGEKMFKMIMVHLDGLMKMDLEDWLTAPESGRWMRKYPDVIKKEEKEWKDCYQKTTDGILLGNNLPKHKFKREGGGYAFGNHWG